MDQLDVTLHTPPEPITSLTNADAIIASLGLQPLEHEGGFFARTWTSPDLHPNGRAAASAIHYLLTPSTLSALHRLDADELWHFYAGDPVEHLQLMPSGESRRSLLGSDVLSDQLQQIVVPRGVWQGARILPASQQNTARHGWSLLGCTMNPGWWPEGFTLGNRHLLSQQFPSCNPLIEALTTRF
jgi:predicted cupin superfamily sugar epimerase